MERENFTGPEDAHRKITAKTYIARMMRLLGVRTWVWVLEFQHDTGTGWPHWHILIDKSDLPGGMLDLKRAWRLWRDQWKLGGLDLSERKSFNDPDHAVLYVTKYLTKRPPAFPVWVLLRTKAIRFVGGCKTLGCIATKPRPAPAPPPPVFQMDLPFRAPRTVLLERMAKCEMSSAIFSLSADEAGVLAGEGDWTWLGTIKAPPADLFAMSLRKELPIVCDAVSWGDGELLTISELTPGGVVHGMKATRDALAHPGYAKHLEGRLLDRQWELLDHLGKFWAKNNTA